MPRRHEDWLRQAKRKLESARWDVQGAFYEDACFSAQQATGRTLDRYYIPTRYPNGFPSGAPMDYYDEPTAQEAVKFAQRIVDHVEKQITTV